MMQVVAARYKYIRLWKFRGGAIALPLVVAQLGILRLCVPSNMQMDLQYTQTLSVLLCPRPSQAPCNRRFISLSRPLTESGCAVQGWDKNKFPISPKSRIQRNFVDYVLHNGKMKHENVVPFFPISLHRLFFSVHLQSLFIPFCRYMSWALPVTNVVCHEHLNLFLIWARAIARFPPSLVAALTCSLIETKTCTP